MRTILILCLILAANAASAHVGHLGEFADHDHWVAAGALGLAGLVAIYGAIKGKQAPAKAEEPEAKDPDEEVSA